MTQMPLRIETTNPDHCAVSPWEASSWASCCLTKGVKSKPALERKSTSEWGSRQIQRQGTELQTVVLRYRFLSLTPHPTWRQKFLFKGRASEDPLVCATAAEGRQCLQVGQVDKKEGWENPVVLQSGSICGQECNTELTSPTTHSRGTETCSGCPERFQRFPLRRQQPRRQLHVSYCEHNCDCSATSPTSPSCSVMGIWSDPLMSAICLQSHTRSKINAAPAGFLNWSHTEGKGSIRTSERATLVLTARIGFLSFLPEKEFKPN